MSNREEYAGVASRVAAAVYTLPSTEPNSTQILCRPARTACWCVNAWSEIAAMVAPAVGFVYLRGFSEVAFPYRLLYLVAWTTFWRVLVTLVTPPEPEPHLPGVLPPRVAGRPRILALLLTSYPSKAILLSHVYPKG